VKISIINEPFVKDFCRTQRWAARTRGRVLRAPDWLAYTTAVLEKNDFDVKLYDFPAEDWGKEELRRLVAKERPDVVVLDSTTPSIYSDIECASIAKEEADSFVIMVGPHATSLPEETLKEAKGVVDAVARGEYEYTVLDVVKTVSDGGDLKDVKGASYVRGKDGNGMDVHSNPDRPLIEDLDELPFPAWHHLDIMKYFDGGKLYPYMDMISGRGCPFECIFCLWPQVMHGRKYRFRSPKNVVDEMQYDIENWPKMKNGEIFFEDDTFTVNKKRAIEVCDEIISRGLDVTWSVNARSNTADLEMFQKMKKAGAREILIGFESGDQEMLDRMKKRITLADSVNLVKLAHKAGLVVHGCFVLGLPGETRETMERTLKFAMDLNMDTAQFSAAMPFPGTEYYNICKDAGLIEATSWADWLADGEQSTVVRYPGLKKEEIEHYVDKGLKQFYFRPEYMVNFLLDTRSLSDLYRKVRGAKNFISYLISSR